MTQKFFEYTNNDFFWHTYIQLLLYINHQSSSSSLSPTFDDGDVGVACLCCSSLRESLQHQQLDREVSSVEPGFRSKWWRWWKNEIFLILIIVIMTFMHVLLLMIGRIIIIIITTIIVILVIKNHHWWQPCDLEESFR